MRSCAPTMPSSNPHCSSIVVTPLFLGEVVRTYSWIIVLGNNGFINAVHANLGIVKQPIQFMFTTFGVVVALVHVTLPVMVVMLAAGAVAYKPRLPEGGREPRRRSVSASFSPSRYHYRGPVSSPA